jgi:hypothetical protein
MGRYFREGSQNYNEKVVPYSVLEKIKNGTTRQLLGTKSPIYIQWDPSSQLFSAVTVSNHNLTQIEEGFVLWFSPIDGQPLPTPYGAIDPIGVLKSVNGEQVDQQGRIQKH